MSPTATVAAALPPLPLPQLPPSTRRHPVVSPSRHRRCAAASHRVAPPLPPRRDRQQAAAAAGRCSRLAAGAVALPPLPRPCCRTVAASPRSSLPPRVSLLAPSPHVRAPYRCRRAWPLSSPPVALSLRHGSAVAAVTPVAALPLLPRHCFPRRFVAIAVIVCRAVAAPSLPVASPPSLPRCFAAMPLSLFLSALMPRDCCCRRHSPCCRRRRCHAATLPPLPPSSPSSTPSLSLPL